MEKGDLLSASSWQRNPANLASSALPVRGGEGGGRIIHELEANKTVSGMRVTSFKQPVVQCHGVHKGR